MSGVYPAGWGGYSNYTLYQAYDGDGLRAKKTDNGVTTYYVRSSVLGSQVTGEVKHSGAAWYWARGYVYGAGGTLLAVQDGAVRWVHSDPVTKGQRLTDAAGNVTSAVDLDPWGGETSRSSNSLQQTRKYTSYERDGSGNDQAMFRQYHGGWARFDQPDPYAGSYDAADPQSFNRYSYVGNDPVNFTDPAGLFALGPGKPPGSIDPSQCYTLMMDGVEVGQFGNCGGGGIAQQPGLGAGQGPRSPQQAHTPDACEDMAMNAQRLADDALRAAGGNASKALSKFDSAFGKFYAGYPMNNGVNIARLALSGGGGPARQAPSYIFGQTGFKREFMETDSVGNVLGGHHDQTHHFAAMFSGGINRYWLETAFHNRGENAGDRRLTNAAYDLGAELRKDPNKLREIGNLIRNKICDRSGR